MKEFLHYTVTIPESKETHILRLGA
ncbi:hypothetical protein PUN4_340227 [Paraburkholderia unamae]|nr:hypothetical protein PUN4_340227 [Paraburkholderia unamae]